MHHFTSYVWIWIRHHGHHSGGQHVWMRSRCCSISCQSCTHSAFAFCSPTHTLMSAYCENFVCFLFCFSFHFTVCDIMHLAGYHKYLHLFDLSHRSQMTCAHAYTHTHTHIHRTHCELLFSNESLLSTIKPWIWCPTLAFAYFLSRLQKFNWVYRFFCLFISMLFMYLFVIFIYPDSCSFSIWSIYFLCVYIHFEIRHRVHSLIELVLLQFES